MIHMKRTVILALAAAAAFAQQFDNQERSLNCDSSRTSQRNDSVSHCEMKEFTIPGVRQVTVDSGQNGGVQVKGWSRSEILVRAQIQAWARGGVDPRGMVSQILIQTAGGMVSANGPRFGNDQGWAVSYEIFVPHRTDLNLKAHNGGIAILDVNGNIESSTVNGGLKLERLAGSVRGRTQNGGLSVELGGTRWDGQEFRAETQNGGVKITLPEFYSAQLETGTVNGRVSLDIPLPNGLSSSKEVSVRIGSGGSLVRATTVNGGVVVKRKS